MESSSGGGTWWNGQANSGTSVTWDFGANRVVDEAVWHQDNGTTHGTWKWQGSLDDSSYTDIGTSFTLGGTAQTQTQLNGNATAYRYYRLLGVSGSASSSPFLTGVTFRIDDIVSTTPDYGNTEGAGDRTATMTVTQSQTSGHGNLLFGRAGTADPIMSLFVDNLNRVDGSGTGALEAKVGSEAVSGKWILFQFSAARVIDELRWFQDALDTNGTWKLQGSNDAITFVDVGTSGTLGGGFDSAYGYSTFTGPSGNTTPYVYYRLLGVSGNISTNPFFFEVAFRTATTNALYGAFAAAADPLLSFGGFYGFTGTASPLASFGATLVNGAFLASSDPRAAFTQGVIIFSAYPQASFTGSNSYYSSMTFAAAADPRLSLSGFVPNGFQATGSPLLTWFVKVGQGSKCASAPGSDVSIDSVPTNYVF